jgi:hypothetical protein
MAAPYNGQVVGLSKIATGTPSAFCREVISGSLSLPDNMISKAGIGGQVHVRAGTIIPTLRFRCVGPAKTDVALWFPTTAGIQVASFPDFLVEVDDTSGMEFVLSGGQPGPCTISLGSGEDAEIEYEFEINFAVVTQQAAGTDVPLYSAFLGHTINDTTIQFGGSDAGCTGFSLSNGISLKAHNPADTKVAGVKRFPSAFGITSYAPRFSCTVDNLYDVGNWDADTKTSLDITITLANGTAGQDALITLDDWVYSNPEIPLEPEDIIGFPLEFLPASGNVYNRVKIT